MSPNWREILSARSDVTGKQEYLTSHAGALNINASFSASSLAISDGVTPSIKATVFDLTDSNPLATQIVDANGDAITSFGGGTQYTDGASSPANPTGTMPVFNNGGSIAAVSDAVGLPVSQIGPITVQAINSDVSVTQSGAWSVTANAGTNLNTSALALDAHLTDKSQFTKLTDGTDTALVTVSGELNVLATAQPGVDIGDVTINNASGVSAVNIQDGGNSITVDYATTGSGTATGALRVELPTNGTGVIATVGAVTAITNALPAGTNGIGKLTSNSGVTIGVVEIAAAQTLATVTTVSTVTNVATIGTSVTPGTSAAHLGKAEDAGHSSGDTGVFALGVRNDTLADVTNTTADYSQLSTDLKGRVMTAGAPRALKGNTQTSLSNTTSETTIIAATASTFHDVYGLILANTGATTTKVSIRDDTAGTVRMIIEVPTLETRGFMLPVDSAVAQTATNKNWTAQCASATTALEVTALYVSMV